MKRLLSLIAVLSLAACSTGPAVNPDPNHTHADFAVWVNGVMLDFSADEYMSAPPADETSFRLIPVAAAHEGEEEEAEALPGRKYLHLHDHNGHVLHSHKPGQTIGQFFASIGLTMTDTCLTLDEHQFETLDAGWVSDFAITKDLCDSGKFHWTMIVNGRETPMDADYAFADLDKILLSYGSSDMAPMEQYAEMTDDACLYSRTCPDRGEPPTENCIADPLVPCVEPE